MLSFVQLVVLALLQGVTELFPVSSLGHTLLLPALLHWSLDRKAPQLLPFLVMLHLGTAIALILYFWRDWVAIVRGWFATWSGKASEEGHLGWMIVVGTIPAGLIGLIFRNTFDRIFHTPKDVAIALTLNGVVLLLGEHWRRRVGELGQASALSLRQALIVGIAQIGALIPGFSRSGLTMVAGLGSGLSHEAAARFAFLLATPIILAAGVLEVPRLFHHHPYLLQALMGGLLTGIAAYLSTAFLVRYFRVGRLNPFAYYCLAAGLISWLLLR
jgi:undecaprenyl-diphosphatase